MFSRFDFFFDFKTLVSVNVDQMLTQTIYLY